MSYGNRELSYQKTQSKPALNFLGVNYFILFYKYRQIGIQAQVSYSTTRDIN